LSSLKPLFLTFRYAGLDAADTTAETYFGKKNYFWLNLQVILAGRDCRHSNECKGGGIIVLVNNKWYTLDAPFDIKLLAMSFCPRCSSHNSNGLPDKAECDVIS